VAKGVHFHLCYHLKNKENIIGVKWEVLKEKVLLVEDEQRIRTLLRLYLEKNNFSVIMAKDGEEALEIVKKRSVDIIVLDIMIPKKNGLEVCRILREHKRLKKIPILYISSLTEKASIISSLEQGGDDYVTKPFDPNEVVARIHAILRRTKQKYGQKVDDHYVYEELTHQERNILHYIEKGYTNKEIAHQLTLTEGTVKVYNHVIYQKLHVKNRTQAIVRAKELQII